MNRRWFAAAGFALGQPEVIAAATSTIRPIAAIDRCPNRSASTTRPFFQRAGDISRAEVAQALAARNTELKADLMRERSRATGVFR